MEQNARFNQAIMLAAKDAENATKILAKSFYKILREKGFTDGQIVNVSSFILDCLLQSLRDYKQKTVETTDSNHLRKNIALRGPGKAVAQINET